MTWLWMLIAAVVVVVGLAVLLRLAYRDMNRRDRQLVEAERKSAEHGDRLLREHLLERYVVTVLSGESFSGLLAEIDDRTLVLRDALVLSANNAKADGDVVLRRESIAYMQRPSA